MASGSKARREPTAIRNRSQGVSTVLEHLTTDDIEIGVHASDWEDAISRSARSLLDAGKITQSYVDAMIEAIHRVGPYIVLADHVALAHARPECGARELAVHFTVLDQGVSFGSPRFDPIRLIITLAAVDDVSHLELMAELAGVLIEPKNIDALIASPTPHAFLRQLKAFLPESLAA